MYIIMGNKLPISTSETRIVKGSKCQRCLRTRVNDVSGLYNSEGIVRNQVMDRGQDSSLRSE